MPRPTKRAAAARLVATYAALLCSPHLGSTRWFRKRSFSPWNLNPAKWPWGHFLSQVPLRAELYRVLLGSTKTIYSRKLQVHILGARANSSGGNGLGEIEDGPAVCNEKQTMDVGLYKWADRGAESVCRKGISVAPTGGTSSFCVILLLTNVTWNGLVCLCNHYTWPWHGQKRFSVLILALHLTSAKSKKSGRPHKTRSLPKPIISQPQPQLIKNNR